MNLSTKQKWIYRYEEQTLVAKEQDEGWTGSLGLADANNYIQNG